MSYEIKHGDCLEVLREMLDCSVQTCVTSPPYFGLRDYGHDGQIGLEQTPDEYVAKMVDVFREVRRVLRDDGTLWLNLGDSYSGGKTGRDDPDRGQRHTDGRDVSRQAEWKTPAGKQRPVPEGFKPKDLIGIPWRVAFALQADGWYLRQDIIWHKPNPMPESVTDRCTKAHEYIFLLSKSARYYYDHKAVKEHGVVPAGTVHRIGSPQDGGRMRQDVGRHHEYDGLRNRRSVWTVPLKPYSGAHFATFPPKLIEPCILAGSAPGDVVLDPFNGSGTTGYVALTHGRQYVGIELNAEYIELAHARIQSAQPRLL